MKCIISMGMCKLKFIQVFHQDLCREHWVLFLLNYLKACLWDEQSFYSEFILISVDPAGSLGLSEKVCQKRKKKNTKKYRAWQISPVRKSGPNLQEAACNLINFSKSGAPLLQSGGMEADCCGLLGTVEPFDCANVLRCGFCAWTDPTTLSQALLI